MKFWRNVSPRGAVSDLIHEWRRPNPYRWQVLGVSIAATFCLMAVFIPESERVPPEKPKITWITTFASDRTDAEIVASNIENQKRQDELQAARERAEARRKEMFRAIGRASGLDVDALEKQYADDPAPGAAPATAPRSTSDR